MMRTVPDQSIARRPSNSGVPPDSSLRKKTRIANETPPTGTEQISLIPPQVNEIIRTVQVETPPPGHSSRKGTSDNGAKSTRNGPRHAKQAIVHRPFPDAEQISNTDIGQDNDTTTPRTLDRSSDQHHGHVDRKSADQTADKEHSIGHKQDRLTAPDVTDLAPECDTGSIGEQIRGSHP